VKGDATINATNFSNYIKMKKIRITEDNFLSTNEMFAVRGGTSGCNKVKNKCKKGANLTVVIIQQPKLQE